MKKTSANNRIRFLRIESKMSSAETALVRLLGLSAEKSQQLLTIGAIYKNKIRLIKDESLAVGDELRVHLQPKRFDISFNWQERILYANENFIVVHKPAGVPAHATLDNHSENLITVLSPLIDSPLFSAHRLDVPTEGLIILARNEKFRRSFGQLLSQQKIEKNYFALTEKEIPPGHLVDYMQPLNRAPRLLVNTPTPGWKECRSDIISVDSVSNFYLSKIRLITGRTHQIRAQFASRQCPLINDTMYRNFYSEDKVGEDSRSIGLLAFSLKFMRHSFELPVHTEEWAKRYLKSVLEV